jgi:O-antigen ligase
VAGPAAAPWSAPAPKGFARARGWGVYLVLAALLVPVLEPTLGGAQAALVDLLNAVAMLAIGFVALARRPRIDLPLIGPVMVISVGSLIAITNAESVAKSLITLVQDAYLYLWFLALVMMLKDRGDQRVVRVAWMWAANVAAAIALYLLLTDGSTTFARIFGPKGFRAVGLFDGPNSLADYLMLSWFVVLSLSGQTNRLVLWGSLAFQMLALIATKSNGAMSSWLLGMVLWAFIRMFSRTGSALAVVASSTIVIGVLLGGFWVVKESGGAGLDEFKKKTFMGRLEHSAEGREQIWQRLFERYQRTPLGIGPGNSSEQRLSMGHRERKHSYRSKEAHNDYLGYLVERGPLGLLGLMLLVALPFRAIWIGFHKVADRAWRAGTGGAIAAALAGGLVATTVHSLTMEKLHFRHYWMFLAIVFAFSATSAPRLVHAGARRRNRSHSRRRATRPIAPHRPGHEIEQSNGTFQEMR